MRETEREGETERECVPMCACVYVCAPTVCLKPTAVCWGAFLRALVRVLRASEYSSWMALIRPAVSKQALKPSWGSR